MSYKHQQSTKGISRNRPWTSLSNLAKPQIWSLLLEIQPEGRQRFVQAPKLARTKADQLNRRRKTYPLPSYLCSSKPQSLSSLHPHRMKSTIGIGIWLAISPPKTQRSCHEAGFAVRRRWITTPRVEGLNLVSANSGGTAKTQQRFYLGPGKFPMGLDLSVRKLRRITTIQAPALDRVTQQRWVYWQRGSRSTQDSKRF